MKVLYVIGMVYPVKQVHGKSVLQGPAKVHVDNVEADYKDYSARMKAQEQEEPQSKGWSLKYMVESRMLGIKPLLVWAEINIKSWDSVLNDLNKENKRTSFEKVSGLKVNLSKSKVYGVGVSRSEVEDMARWEKKLKYQLLRIYALETCKQIAIADKMSHDLIDYSYHRSSRGGVKEEQQSELHSRLADLFLPQMHDRWYWYLEARREFLMKSVRNLVDDSLLYVDDVPTRWVKVIPIKVNVFAQIVCMNKLPTRLNLSLRGLEITSIVCPLCHLAVDSTSHLLFSCSLARQLRSKVLRWWELDDQETSSYDKWLI
ncbi:RNA-directed DNA polymerase, eukaryota [Tanacetum coccineum]